jgi:hypothetical protein
MWAEILSEEGTVLERTMLSHRLLSNDTVRWSSYDIPCWVGSPMVGLKVGRGNDPRVDVVGDYKLRKQDMSGGFGGYRWMGCCQMTLPE